MSSIRANLNPSPHAFKPLNVAANRKFINIQEWLRMISPPITLSSIERETSLKVANVLSEASQTVVRIMSKPPIEYDDRVAVMAIQHIIQGKDLFIHSIMFHEANTDIERSWSCFE